MNPKNYPKVNSILGLLSANPNERTADLPSQFKRVEQGNKSGLQLEPNDSDISTESLRYAHNTQGMLSHRDPEVVRRYILDAQTPEQQADRQNELFQCASVALGCVPGGHSYDLLGYAQTLKGVDRRVQAGVGESFKSSGVMNCGVFACPVVVTFGSPKSIFTRLPLDHFTQLHLANSIQKSLAMCSATPLAYVRVESMIAVTELNAVTPLQIQSAASNETRRLFGDFKASSVHIPETMKSIKFDAFRKHQGGWSMKLAQTHDLWTVVGPNQPVAFLIIGYFGWDRFLPSPLFVDHSPVGKQKLCSLLEGYLAQDRCSSNGELGAYATPGRVHAEVGTPMWVHEALTKAQAMQFKVMEQRAVSSQSRFECKVEHRGSILHWTARASQDQSEFQLDAGDKSSASVTANSGLIDTNSVAVVEHVYDAFWRPEGHVREIELQLAPQQIAGTAQSNPIPVSTEHDNARNGSLH